MLLRFNVTSDEAAALGPGLAVSFRADGVQRDGSATVAHIAGAADPQTRLVGVLAEIHPADAAGLRANAFAQVRAAVGVPRSAVLLGEMAVRPGEKGFLAFVIEGEGEAATARERRLELGLRTAAGVEVRSGIAPGERVVVRGAEALRDGSLVRLAGDGK